MNDTMKITITDQAKEQIKLILQNDYTIEEKTLRLTIAGKECDGFTYNLGFNPKHPDDSIIDFKIDDDFSFQLVRDPLTTHYFNNGIIDFKLDAQNNSDGFIITNHDQENFKGKFFKDESLTPSHLKPNE